MENIREMKELGAEIHFCPTRRSYFYVNEFRLIIGLGCQPKRKIMGGLEFRIK